MTARPTDVIRRLSHRHEGRDTALPEFYRRADERMLGHYAELLSDADRTPDLSQTDPQPHHLTVEKR